MSTVDHRPQAVSHCPHARDVKFVTAVRAVDKSFTYSRTYKCCLTQHKVTRDQGCLRISDARHKPQSTNQGHREFPFGNSRESATSKIPGGNSRELLSSRWKFPGFYKIFPILVISCCELWHLADMKTHFPPLFEFKSLNRAQQTKLLYS